MCALRFYAAALIAARGGESLPFLSAAVHPHTWMFSATWPPGVAQLAAKLLLPGAVHVAIGSTTEDRGPEGEGGQALVAAASVTQRFEQMKGKGAPRMRRLTELLAEILGAAKTSRLYDALVGLLRRPPLIQPVNQHPK